MHIGAPENAAPPARSTEPSAPPHIPPANTAVYPLSLAAGCEADGKINEGYEGVPQGRTSHRGVGKHIHGITRQSLASQTRRRSPSRQSRQRKQKIPSQKLNRKIDAVLCLLGDSFAKSMRVLMPGDGGGAVVASQCAKCGGEGQRGGACRVVIVYVVV